VQGGQVVNDVFPWRSIFLIIPLEPPVYNPSDVVLFVELYYAICRSADISDVKKIVLPRN
jgi:hypothetical protein